MWLSLSSCPKSVHFPIQVLSFCSQQLQSSLHKNPDTLTAKTKSAQETRKVKRGRMSEVLMVPSYSCCKPGKGSQISRADWKQKPVITTGQCRLFNGKPKLKPLIIKAEMVNPSTYSSRISTDIPLYEVPGASFDQYLEDKPRVFRAMFPDKGRSQQLNEEEWRIHMLPIDFLFLTVQPVIDMKLRCKSEGIEYPPGVPLNITKIIELEIIRWELHGLDDMLKPSHFSLGVKGVLYRDRLGSQSRLKGRLQMSIGFIPPAVLSLVPKGVRQEVAELVLKRLMENMKNKVNGSLLADYSTFKREKSMNLV